MFRWHKRALMPPVVATVYCARRSECRSRCRFFSCWEEAASGWGSSLSAELIGERKRLLLGELPLRGAAELEKGIGCFWEVSRCAGLLDWRKEEAAFGGAPAARGCWITDRRTLLLVELPLRGAARSEKGRSCFGGELPLRGAAR